MQARRYRGKLAMASELNASLRDTGKEKDHYRHDPMHRRKPGVGWTPTEAGWTKPRIQQVPVQTPIVPMESVARELRRVAKLLME